MPLNPRMLGTFLKTHPVEGPVLAAVALAALIRVHPMRDLSHDTQEALTGDPNAVKDLMTVTGQRYAVGALGHAGIHAQLSELQPGLSAIAHESLPNYYRGPNPNPDGSLVFGLYSSRLKG